MSLTESNVSICIGTVWSAIDISSDLYGKIKREFYQDEAMSVLLYG